MLEQAERRYANAVKQREAAEALGRRERRRELPAALEREANAREELRIREQARDRHGPPGDEARHERQIARQVLAERAEPAILAARLSPPEYVLTELGERPNDPAKAKAWGRGVRSIETYRHEHGVTYTGSALGRESEGGRDRRAYDRASDAVQDAQRRLERLQQLDRSMQRSHNAGRDTGDGHRPLSPDPGNCGAALAAVNPCGVGRCALDRLFTPR